MKDLDQPRAGRPTKFDPDTAGRIITAIRAGNYLTTAAAFAGIDRQTIYRWLTEAEQDDAPPALVEFRDGVARARAEAEVRVVTAVRRGIEGGVEIERSTRRLKDGSEETTVKLTPPNARDGLAFLKVAFSDRWNAAERREVEVSGPGGGPVRVSGDEVALGERIAAVRRRELLEGSIEGEVESEG
jgi:hypothetical protein